MSLVVLVTGGRDFGEWEGVAGKDREVAQREKRFVLDCLDRIHGERGIRLLVHGACVRRGDEWIARGADGSAEVWARLRQVNYVGVPAKWAKLGKRAGMVRNAEMLELLGSFGLRVDAGVAFPGGVGTAGMCTLLEKAGVAVWKPAWL